MRSCCLSVAAGLLLLGERAKRATNRVADCPRHRRRLGKGREGQARLSCCEQGDRHKATWRWQYIALVLIGKEISYKNIKIRLASNCGCPGGEPCVSALSPRLASPHIRPQTHTESSTQHDQHQQRPSTTTYRAFTMTMEMGRAFTTTMNMEIRASAHECNLTTA